MCAATHNVDPPESSKFAALAARWWDPHSEFKPMHETNPLRLDYVDQIAGIAGKELLYVGCVGGTLDERRECLGCQVTASSIGELPREVPEPHVIASGD